VSSAAREASAKRYWKQDEQIRKEALASSSETLELQRSYELVFGPGQETTSQVLATRWQHVVARWNFLKGYVAPRLMELGAGGIDFVTPNTDAAFPCLQT
jgi:hypothetical protein